MELNMAKELAALQKMTPGELRQEYAKVFQEESHSCHKEWLIKRIAWRMQANAEGDLSDRAKRRALELANDSDLRVKAPLSSKVATPETVSATAQRSVTRKVSLPAVDGAPRPGTVLTREYKGQNLQVAVKAEGFEFEGETYKTLSALAKKITGTHTSGNLFFRVGQHGGRGNGPGAIPSSVTTWLTRSWWSTRPRRLRSDRFSTCISNCKP